MKRIHPHQEAALLSGTTRLNKADCLGFRSCEASVESNTDSYVLAQDSLRELRRLRGALLPRERGAFRGPAMNTRARVYERRARERLTGREGGVGRQRSR